MLLLAVLYTARGQLALYRSGGVGTHCASLSEKLAVLDYVQARPGRPKLVATGHPNCQGGWKGLGRERRWNQEGEERYYYLLEAAFGTETPAAQRALALPDAKVQSFRSVRVVESPVYAPLHKDYRRGRFGKN
jgi:hypothetical protein